MKFAPVFALAVLFVICAAKDFRKLDNFLDEQWENFKISYNKQYDGDEIVRRMIWERNLEFIRDHNHKADMRIHSYHLGMNQFGDMTQHEINSFMLYNYQAHLGFGHNNNRHHVRAIHNSEAHKNESIPNYVDWRESGRVTDVKDQGYNNASWAFAAVGVIEGVLVRVKQRLIDLSEQQLIDCLAHNQFLWPTSYAALNYVRKVGIETEIAYPYTGIKVICAYNRKHVVLKTGHCTTIINPEEYYLTYSVAKEGPVSVAIDASQTTFHFYKYGVYDDKSCSTTYHNHEALVVGYANEYFLVKNSWGKSWGDDGYIKIARHKDNQCGIYSHVVYPYYKNL